MGSSARSVSVLLLVAAGLAAIATPASPQSSGAVRAGAAAETPDMSRWRLTRHGFGRLKLGLNRAKIERRTGRSLKFAYNTGSCAIWSIRGARGLSLMLVRGRLVRVYIAERSWRTSEGVRVGDSEATVRSRYDRLRTEQHAYDPDGEYLIVPGPRRRVVFETDGNGDVTGIRAGRMPEVMYIEGCA